MYPGAPFVFCHEKSPSGAGPEIRFATRSAPGEFKYHGNWYGNRLGLTICVNTKTLLSRAATQRFGLMRRMLPASFH
jgi:hypothetical protein